MLVFEFGLVFEVVFCVWTLILEVGFCSFDFDLGLKINFGCYY